MINQSSIKLVESLYKAEDGKPITLSETQTEIFETIFGRKHPRNIAITYTQFGKSLTVGLSILTRIANFPEKWVIVAPSNKKAQIIMGYIIDHIFDNEFTAKMFEVGKDESREKIRRERRKDRINLRHPDGKLGEVFIISVEGRRTKDVLDAIMGFGAQNVVVDESSLIEDVQYAGILRMLGGHEDNFLFEIGNAMRRNHFYRSSRDKLYNKISVTGDQGVAEKRISQSFLDEMKRTISPQLYKILYECEFPPPDAVDDKGYAFLLTEYELDNAYQEHVQLFGTIRLGVDVAGGGKNYSTIVVRGDNGAKLLFRESTADTMNLVGQVLKFKEEYKATHIYVDPVGVGKGTLDRLKEQTDNVFGINNGEKPEHDEDFADTRSQSNWRMSEWIKQGGKLLKDTSFDELLSLKWKIQSDKKVKLMPKSDMLALGIQSPDTADALALTFARTVNIRRKSRPQRRMVPISPYENIG